MFYFNLCDLESGFCSMPGRAEILHPCSGKFNQVYPNQTAQIFRSGMQWDKCLRWSILWHGPPRH